MLGALDMFSIGIGPSSSHTIGPMKAAYRFIHNLQSKNQLNNVKTLQVDLYGSLALTGEGHGTLFAILNGLCGEDPKTIDPDKFISQAKQIKADKLIKLFGTHQIDFSVKDDIRLNQKEFLKEHANGMKFSVIFNDNTSFSCKYFSIGGGFVLDEAQMVLSLKSGKLQANSSNLDLPYPFKNATELFKLCSDHEISIAELVTRNELGRKTREQIRSEALEIISVMHDSIINGLNTEGELPGGLQVKRRSKGIYDRLKNQLYGDNTIRSHQNQQSAAMAYAMAVNEENADFKRIVTAPTNGAAGTIPAVLEYYRNFCNNVTEEKQIEFLLTAGAVGILYKFGASISAAEVGCQGEIGVACSMAAAALTTVLGGSLIQIEKAAEIAMEHSLGMTCDPINGLVQIPCIERNAIAATKAIDIARFTLLEDMPGKISLDQVIKTMWQTGKDMSSKYKETSLGGLATNTITVNMISC